VRDLDGRLQPGQLVVHGLVGRDVRVPDPRVEGVQVAVEQGRVDLDLNVATGPDRAVIREPHLAADPHVQQ